MPPKFKSTNKNLPPSLMILGTASNAGKSIITAGLCRALRRKGMAVAPFKAQNMSLNSWVTESGGEIGIAQAIQARAAGLAPSELMNPVLLKPMGGQGSQIILLGKPTGIIPYAEYIQKKAGIWEMVKNAYADLARGKDAMILEGAGSPAEINLRPHDIVNINMALHAGSKALLVADIDRGGAFAALAGTMRLLNRRDRSVIAAFILNKFRGDATLLKPAMERVSQLCKQPFIGIIPYLANLRLPDEDSMTLAERGRQAKNAPCGHLDVAVIQLPAISNITDWDPLLAEQLVSVRLVETASDLGAPHIVIIPGSRNTPQALEFLRQTGLASAIINLAAKMRARKRGQIVGLCAGLEILGQKLMDPAGLEARGEHEGLGLIPLVSTLAKNKILRRAAALAHAALCGLEMPCRGQEIHHGQCQSAAPVALKARNGAPLGYMADESGQIWGTWLHGIFEADEFRHAWLNKIANSFGLGVVACAKYDLEAELEKLADAVEENLDMEVIMKWLGK